MKPFFYLLFFIQHLNSYINNSTCNRLCGTRKHLWHTMAFEQSTFVGLDIEKVVKTLNSLKMNLVKSRFLN